MRQQRWTTVLTVLCGEGNGGTLWVDVERVSTDPFARVPFRAPGLVTKLIRDGDDPRVGHVRLAPGPEHIPVGGLAGLISNADRRLPIIVFSHDRLGDNVTMERAQSAYDRLAGVAGVMLLRSNETEAFKAKIGEDLAVWGGGARLYLPNRGRGGLHPRRHRYVSGAVAARGIHAVGDRFVQLLASTVPATPAPPEYEAVRRTLRSGQHRTVKEFLEYADQEISAKDTEIEQLRDEIAQLKDEAFEYAVDKEELAKQLNVLSGQFAVITKHALTDGDALEEDELPNEIDSISEAIAESSRLPHIVVHSTAPVDIQKLEVSESAGAWANGIWRGLRALNEYASNPPTGTGGFRDWCRTSGSPWSWPPSDKKLAMKESDTVMQTTRLLDARSLPVDAKIHKSGRTTMVAHLKIAQGGGSLAPRIYFLDDTAGATKKVHIGFIGPHEHMPNASTN